MENELEDIRSKIHTIRGVKVMLDFDLAALYGVETRVMKQSVKRNIDRFPEDFMYKLDKDEAKYLISMGVSQNVIPPNYNVGASELYAFTEEGVAMLSGILRSKVAIRLNIQIMRAFVQMRNYLATTANLTAELEELKKKLAVLERTDSNKQLAINKISKDIDNIYLAIAALSITAPPVQKPKPINRIGFKQNSTKK
jgi:hypothetical protein